MRLARRALLIAPAAATAAATSTGPFEAAMRAAEALGGGRLGVAIRDAATGREWGWRAGERFPLTSTFKLVLAAAILARVDRGELRLAQPL
ncbi:MAG TPA: serine hydrolase, partial [Roseococcus sp.]|nr:serine hydrolase [Roseococcus sp.]